MESIQQMLGADLKTKYEVQRHNHPAKRERPKLDLNTKQSNVGCVVYARY